MTTSVRGEGPAVSTQADGYMDKTREAPDLVRAGVGLMSAASRVGLANTKKLRQMARREGLIDEEGNRR